MAPGQIQDGTRPALGGPLYAFALPPQLLDNFKARELHIPDLHPLNLSKKKVEQAAESVPSTSATLAIGGAFTCGLTGASFPDLAALREHYKSDWYKYNVKLRSQGKPAGVTEDQFDALVEGLSASISGSDSSISSEESVASSTGAISRLLKKQGVKDTADEDMLNEIGTSLLGPRSAVLWFEAPDAAPGTQFGVYRAALPEAGKGKKREDGPEVLKEIRSLQLLEGKAMGKEGVDPSAGRKWTLLMFGGGHFAGMVVSLVPRLVSKGKGKEKEREVVIIEKKTFHRYTTRRKQGGSQAAHDGGKGKAKSAGAQIRRYNEVALTEDVQGLLESWKEEIQGSELIFLRASKTNYKTFFGYEGAPIDKKDPRIRGFSFPTRRPTISELIRAFTELTRVKTSYLTLDALAKLDSEYLASITPAPAPVAPTPKPLAIKAAVVKLTKEEEMERDRWTRLVDMVRRGKTEALAAFLDKYGPELEPIKEMERGVWGTLPDWMEEARTTPTLLHVASIADQPEMVRWLLVEKRADPTVAASAPPLLPQLPDPSTLAIDTIPPAPATLTSSSTRPILTPYELAPSRATRNVFRFLTADHPDWWDWTGSGATGARVPSGLTEEKEEEREQKDRERRAKLRDKLKIRDKEREAKETIEREKVEKEEKLRADKEVAELLRTGKNKIVPTGPQRLGGGPPRAIVARDAEAAGLSELQQARVAREMRARAAEARMARPS